jgi:adenylyl- and sulfurtransferase ThiI
MKQQIFLSEDTITKLNEAAASAGLSRSKLITRLLDQVAFNLTTEEIAHASESIRTMIRNKSITQKEAFLHLLKTRAEISSKLAKALGIKNPSYVVHVLREDGHLIECKWAYQESRRNKTTNFKIYSLQCA